MPILPLKSPDKNATAAYPKSALGRHLGNALAASHEKHKARRAVSPSSPDYSPLDRQAALLYSFLQHDTPLRREMFEQAGLGAAEPFSKWMSSLSQGILAEVDARHASGECLQARLSTFTDSEKPGVEPPALGFRTNRLSDVAATEVEWLWPQRVPVGKLTLISGDPDLGKTWTVLDVMARVTAGRPFPDAPNPAARSGHCARRDVLWVSGEDDDSDTVKPRLVMLGADVSRVHSLSAVTEMVSDKGGKKPELKTSSLDLGRHLGHLDDWLSRHPLVVMVAIDPLAAFLGGTDSYKNTDVRALLTPLTQLASKRRVALVGINHLAKGDGTNSLYRGMGSIAFVAAARSSWMVSRDPEEPKNRRLLTRVKNNLGSEDVGGLAFRVGPQVPGSFCWEEGTIDISADDALRQTQREAESSMAPAKAEAKEWLRQLLAKGKVSAEDVWSKAKADGLSQGTIKLAKKELTVVTTKTSTGWVWQLSKPTT